MTIRDAAWNKMKWAIMKRHLGYSAQEMELFRSNPRNEDVLSKVPALLEKTIIIEVVEAAVCNSGHKAGDQFFLGVWGRIVMELKVVGNETT